MAKHTPTDEEIKHKNETEALFRQEEKEADDALRADIESTKECDTKECDTKKLKCQDELQELFADPNKLNNLTQKEIEEMQRKIKEQKCGSEEFEKDPLGNLPEECKAPKYPVALIRELRKVDRVNINKTCSACATRKPLAEMGNGLADICTSCKE